MTGTAVAGTSDHTPAGPAEDADARPPRDAPRRKVEFRALGPIEAMVGGRQVDLGAPKQRALLALLVSRVGRPVTVDVMLEALWAGRPPRSATTSLQAYVANLRRALEPDRAPRTPATVLRTCPQGYQLDGRVVDLDVHRFGERATAGWQARDRGDPQRALTEFEAGLALWRGQAYVEVANATWVAPDAARLEELRLSVVEARCAALLAVGAHEVAVAELEAFIQAHPLREYGCELLSLALYRAGRQADALGVLRTTQARLTEELGIDPRPALQDLERDILNQAPSLDWQPASDTAVTSRAPAAAPESSVVPSSPAVPGPPPSSPAVTPAPESSVTPSRVTDGEIFVGRDGALRQLGETLAAAEAGRGRVVTVSGEPGIGKTSLLRRFATVAEVPVIRGTCPEHVDAPPLWLWEQVLRALGACFPRNPIPALVAELLDGDAEPMVDGADVAGATLRRFEAIVRYLTDAARTTPVVVLLDNLHRADTSSLRLLAHLAESVPASRLLLAVSYRSNEAAALPETLAALARAGMTRIELEGLNTQETQALASAVLQQEVGKRTAEGLWARTEGNPFFLRELIKVLADEGRLDRPGTAPVPAPVREVVLRRISRLPETAAGLLSVAAVAGRDFDIEVVAEAASAEIETALEVLDTAVEAGLVTEDQERLGWFRFTHALAAETLYQTTGRLRRARLHRQVGTAAVRAWAGNAEMAAEIARHWVLAAELDPSVAAQAAGYAAEAARIADGRPVPDEATALWRQAVAAADLADKEDLDRHPLLIGLGASLYRAGHPDEALPVFVQAMEELLAAQEAGGDLDASRLAGTAVTLVSELSWCPVDRGDVGKRLVEVFERARSRVTEPVHRALVLSCLAVARHHDGDPEGGAELSDEALALAQVATDDEALAQVLHLRAAVLNGPDHLAQRLKAVNELLALPGLPPLMTVRARQLRAQAHVALGRVPEASAELDLAAQRVEGQRSLVRVQLAWSRAGLLLVAGRWREGDELSRATYHLHARMKWGSAEFNRMVQRWEAAYLAGGDADLVEEVRAVAESAGEPGLYGILAMALVEAGHVHDARIALRRFRCAPKDHLWLYTRCWALLAAARLGEIELLTRLRAQLLPYRHLTCSVSDVAISGSVAYFTGEAALALGDADAARDDLAVAADTARRMGSGPWQAQVDEAVVRAENALGCGAR